MADDTAGEARLNLDLRERLDYLAEHSSGRLFEVERKTVREASAALLSSAEAREEAFQQYVDANEARIDAETRAQQAEARVAYWLAGTEIVEKRLAKAAAADPSGAPMPLHGRDAELWHAAQADAYRDALEMMGVPQAARQALQQGEGNG